MNNYLLQLLKEVKTLIIPGLGALTVTNEATGEILFMPYLKFDDGTLAKHIASKENMEINDATNLISKFVREVTAELDKGNSYDMYQFGRFVKIDGEIAFEAWNTFGSGEQKPAEAPVKQESVKQEPVKEEIPVVPVVEQVLEETKPEEPTAETPPVAEEPKPEAKAEKIVQPAVEEPKKPEEPSIKVENLKVEEAKIVPPVTEKPEAKAPEKPLPKKEPVKKEQPVKETKPSKEKKKNPVFSYILWGFLVLILGSGTFIAIRFDSLKKDFPILADLAGENDNVAKGSEDVKQLEDEPDVNIDSQTASEPIPEDEVQVVEDQLPEETTPVKEAPKKEKAQPKKETPAPKQTVTPKPVVTPPKKTTPKKQTTGGTSTTFDGSKHFHVIAGSFGSEANANKLAGKLRNQGFPEASVTINNGMYRVSVKGFGTLNEATAEASKMQNSVPGAWVLKI
jgi:cell division septation protein DedD